MNGKTPALYEDYKLTADFISGRFPSADTAVILGSGLESFSDELEDKSVIPYSEIPGFPVSTVSYQKGELISGIVAGKRIIVMNGRFHRYEGWEMWQCAYPVGVFHILGVKNIIITNAAGGVDTSYIPGDIVLVRDHIKMIAESPVSGRNIPEFGERFFDLQRVYSDRLAEYALESASKEGIAIRDGGVYWYMSGPQFETPAEIRVIGILGATLVGMSTVPEVIQAAHCGMEALVLSCVTNNAAGLNGSVPYEEEVVYNGHSVSRKLTSIICGVISRI